MNLEANDVPAIAAMLSAERLGALAKLTGSQMAAIELHQETLRVGTDLMMVIATTEIAIRNSVSENLSQHFGVPAWLTQPPSSFQWRDVEADKIKLATDSARRAEYSKMNQAQKGGLDAKAYPRGRPANTPHLRRAKARRQNISVTEGKVIAELTLYFWKRLYGPEYEHSLWRPTLRRTFPDKKIKRAEVATNLEVMYQTRNRLAHHEPVLNARFRQAMKAIEFVTQRLGQNSPTIEAPLSKLVQADIARVKAKAIALHDRIAAYRV